MIEQGANFEGSCKMTQVSGAVDKNKKTFSADDQLHDTTRVKTATAASSSKSSEITNISDIAS